MDLVAGLHWLRENLPAFNGNPNMVTLMGHGHGAALANILIVSPVASGTYGYNSIFSCAAHVAFVTQHKL
jgi:carboxylesterase type B